MAAEKKYYWLKLPQGYLDDPRIKKLRKIAGGDTYTIIYLKMQLLSVSTGGVIPYEQIEPTFEEELALKIDEDVEDIKLTITYLFAQKLIECNDNDYLLVETATRIGGETAAAERVRRFRQKKTKLLQSNADVTKSNAILDIDKDKEKDIESIETKSSDKPRSNKFIKPTVEEIAEYCRERDNGIDAQQFYDFYESKGWLIGKTKMKDWKAAVRTWERRNQEQNAKSNASSKSNYKKPTYKGDYDGD